LAGGNPASAIQDITRAIDLAPVEAHLYALRAQARRLLGDDAAAQLDQETAQSLDASLS
jgi:Flp pilus assembly protein TadD